MNNQERGRRIARLAHLGVPQAFHASIAERTPPRGHTLMHAAIILASIGLAVLALVAWSRYVAMIAESAAEREGAQLYNSDLGLELLGGLFTVLFAAGWLCSWLTRSRGSEGTRNGTAYDLIHEPAKNKAITDRIWRWMVARRLPAANANHFLDCLAGSLARYLMLAALGSFAITAVLWWLVPAHYSLASNHGIEDRSLPFGLKLSSRPLMSVIKVTTGCPDLPRGVNTLIYDIQFSDGTDADLGSWKATRGDALGALERIAAQLPPGIPHDRISNPIHSAPLSANCLNEFGGPPGTDAAKRLSKLLDISAAEKQFVR